MAIVSTFPEKRGLNTDDINDIANGEISNGFVQSQFNFSTEEQVIGKWINGKPLYQKTISFGTLPNNTSKTVAHNISNLDIVTNLEGIAIAGTRNITLPSDVVVGSSYSITTERRDGNILIGTNFDASGFSSSYVTIQYTKTTD